MALTPGAVRSWLPWATLRFNTRSLLQQAGRAAGGAHAWRKEFGESEWMDPQRLTRLQARRLGPALRSAVRDVPFYAGRRLPRSDEPDEVFEALQCWPLLDKETVADAGDALLSRRARWRFPAYSSGTSGRPLKTWRTAASIAHEAALQERQLRWAGWRPGERRVWLRGDVVVPLEQTEPPFWHVNAADQMLMCSSFHLWDRHAGAYLDAIEAFDPVVIQAYPSAIGFLAAALREQSRGYAGASLRAIVTSSEALPGSLREGCEAAFGVQVFDWYGQSERVAAIGTCPRGRYHLIEDASYVELLPAQDGLAEIVGSSWANDAMPLIRYRTGDLVLPTARSCRCGRPLRRVERIVGRETDAIVTPDGRRHVMLDFIFNDVLCVREAQIVQEAPDHIVVLLVLQPGSNPSDADVVRYRALQRLGAGVHVDLHCVPAIPRSPSGKRRLIVSRLAPSTLAPDRAQAP
jgi:phenylacetate-CoA ligase